VKRWAALVLFTACAADEPDELLEHRFSARPVMLVASSELAAECLANLEAAVIWYQERGTTLTLVVLDPLARVLNGFVVGGQVAVVPGRLNANVRGDNSPACAYGARQGLLGIVGSSHCSILPRRPCPGRFSMLIAAF
jgi:hypothetical protein